MVYVRVVCGVRYVSMGLRQEEDIIQPMERMTSSGDRHQDCRVQVQVEKLEDWLTHNGVWGSNQLVFIEPTQSRKVVQLEEVKIVII